MENSTEMYKVVTADYTFYFIANYILYSSIYFLLQTTTIKDLDKHRALLCLSIATQKKGEE